MMIPPEGPWAPCTPVASCLSTADSDTEAREEARDEADRLRDGEGCTPEPLDADKPPSRVADDTGEYNKENVMVMVM